MPRLTYVPGDFELRVGRSKTGLGLYAEDIVVASGRQSGNFPQAYSHVGLINAAFRLSRPWS